MRTLPILTVLLVLETVAACNDARQPDTGGVFVGPAPREGEPKSATDFDAGPDAPLGVMIGGRVETDDGEPIIGRPIAVVDARGLKREVLSDEGGTFWVADVVRPYDLVVEGAPSGDVRTPTVFFGLTRIDPFIELFERDGPKTRPPAQTLRFGVRPPPCIDEPCFVSVASGSLSGSGASSVGYRDEASIAFDLEHEWSGEVAAKETITLHVLAFDGARTTFAHAQIGGIRGAAGELTELGILAPMPVDASAPLLVSANARGPAAAWAPSIATYLDLPGGASMSFTYEASREQTLRVPLVAGATLRANAWMQHPPVPDRPQFHTAVQAWTGARPISANGGTLACELPELPVLVRPEMDGTLSAGGLGLAWTNPKSAPLPLSEITIARADSGALAYRVWTMGDEVPFAKLALLGLPSLSPGDHVIGVTSSPGESLDDLAHPDPSTRHARNDPRRRGTAAYQRFRFRISP